MRETNKSIGDIAFEIGVVSSVSNTDPAEILARRQGGTPTPELIESIKIEFGLDKPIAEG